MTTNKADALMKLIERFYKDAEYAKGDTLVSISESIHNEFAFNVAKKFYEDALNINQSSMSEVQNRGRLEISDEQVAKAIQVVQDGLECRFKRHGQFSHFSKHESHGIIVEECREMEDAVRSKNHQDYWDEVLDVIVAGIWGIASRIARDEQNGSIFVLDDDM